jgi:glycosyltransferase involved in cell wall biosynthesis
VRICMLLERREGLAHDARVRRAGRALARAGHDVVLLHVGDHDVDPALVGDGYRTLTARPSGRPGHLLERLPAPIRRVVLWGALVRHVVRLRPDAVHAHDLPMLLPGWGAAAVTRAALVFDTHEYAAGVPYHSRLSRLIARLLQRALLPRCSAVIAVSPATAERLRADHHLARPPVVVRNLPELSWEGAPGSLDAVLDLRAELNLGDAPLVLHQGAVMPERGCEEMVRAVCAIDDAHLLFLGDVAQGIAEGLAGLAGRCGARERVHFLPSVAPEVLLAHTSQADLGLCLFDPRWMNHRLTLQNKVFEYIAAGVPQIAVRGTAFGDLVEDLQVGWTVGWGDVEELAATIRAGVRHCEDPLLHARLDAAHAELSWEREQERLLDVYGDLLADASSPPASGDAVPAGR